MNVDGIHSARPSRRRPAAVTALISVLLVLASLASPFQTAAHAADTTVSGTITGDDAPGVGVAGIGVYLYHEPNYDGEFPDPSILGDYLTTTDADGNYRVTLASGGLTQLVMASTQYAWSTVSVAVTPGQTTSGQNFQLTFEPMLTFTVHDDDAAKTPVDSHFFGLALGGQSAALRVKSGPDGSVVFAHLPQGNFRLYDGQTPKAFPDQRIIVSNENVTVPDIVFPAPIVTTALSVSISLEGGGAYDEATVSLTGVAPTTKSYTAPVDSFSRQATLPAVDPGTYRLSAKGTDPAFLTTWWQNSITPDGATTVVVGGSGTPQSFSIALRKAGVLTSVRPVISGTATFDGVLTAVTAAWGPAPVALEYQWTRNGQPIPEATSKTYTVVGADLGLPLSVQVTGTKFGYATGYQSAASVTPPPGFTTTPIPTVSGSTVPGSTLSAIVGAWVPAPDSFTYAWLRNGVVISGETKTTHRLVTADLGARITFAATAIKSGIPSVTRTSAPSAPVLYQFASVAPPTISGRPTIGTQLSASTGSVTPAATSFTFAWLRNGVAITGATTSKYTPRASDTGSTLSVLVTAVRSNFVAFAQTSVSTVVIQNGFTGTPTPAIIGAAKVGVTLVASTASWQPLPVQLSFQWKVDGVVVPSAGGTIYNPSPADIGKTITLTVTGTKVGYLTESRSSVATRPVVGALTASTPTVTGTAKAGSTLTAKAGTWGPAPVTLAYRWLRGGTPISGAVTSTYRVTTADAGRSITLTVTGTKVGYATQSRTSAVISVAP